MPAVTAPTSGTGKAAPRAAAARRGGRDHGALACLVGLVLVVVLTLLSLRIGSVSLSTTTVVDAFVAFDGSSEHLIVRTLRLPRTVIAIAVGAALAVAGVTMQAVTRNVLASPTVLGVNAGAAFAIVTAVFVLGVVSPGAYVWFAFAGALVATAVVFVVGSAGRGGATPLKLALAGAVVTALLQSWIWAAMVLSDRTLDEVRFWLAGSVAGRDLGVLARVAPFLLLGLIVAALLARQLDALSLGDAMAAGLGLRTAQVRALALGVAVLLAGAAVSVAGPIGFVGLAVPHIVRSVVGPRHVWLLPAAALGGTSLLLAADIIGRVVMRPEEIQVGIVTAIVGAPVLIHLVRRRTVGVQ
ncbi:MAG: FecCD family ABC transporter permease [Nitriliruptoraceae bacterium]